MNRIGAGENYGWPYVAGYRDDKAYVFADWSKATACEQLAYSDYTIPSGVPQQKESDWSDPHFAPPLYTFYTVESDHDFHDPKCGGDANVCWPTIAPSSLDVYPAGARALPGWTESLLITSLKEGTVYRLPLTKEGEVQGAAMPLFKTTNRYRDIALNPDGRTFYVVTDNGGTTASLDGGATSSLDDPGALLEFRADSPRAVTPGPLTGVGIFFDSGSGPRSTVVGRQVHLLVDDVRQSARSSSWVHDPD